MTSTPFDVVLPAPATEVPGDYIHAEGGVRSWLLTRDHKRIALLFLFGVSFSLALGGLFALLLRLELLTPERTLMGAGMYNRMFTLHGIVMVFMFMIPAIWPWARRPIHHQNRISSMIGNSHTIRVPKMSLLRPL